MGDELPSIEAPVPDTIDKVGCKVIWTALKYGAILTSLNPLMVTPELTINFLEEVMLLLIKSPVVACKVPETMYWLKFE